MKLARARTSRRSIAWLATGLDERMQDADARMPHSVMNMLLAAAAAHLRLPDVGLLAAETLEPGDMNLIELVLRSQATLGDALANLPRLLPLLHDAAELRQTVTGDATELEMVCNASAPVHPVGYDFVMALLVIGARRVTGRPDLCPTDAFFCYPERADISQYERIFGCELHFDHAYCGVRFTNESLELPLVHANSRIAAALERVALEQLAAGHKPNDFHTRVLTAISQQLAAGQECTVVTTARRLGMSARTLQRRLDDSHTSFRSILDEHRARLARAYLGELHLSIAEIAYLLGFATPQAFHRAFKRWTGRTPAQFRSATPPPP